jgi:hypothetical protein
MDKYNDPVCFRYLGGCFGNDLQLPDCDINCDGKGQCPKLDSSTKQKGTKDD